VTTLVLARGGPKGDSEVEKEGSVEKTGGSIERLMGELGEETAGDASHL